MTSTRGDGVIGSDDIALLIGKRLCLRELCRLSGQNGVHFRRAWRPKGSKNKYDKAFWCDLYQAWAELQ